ncbi:MAG TPA: hypothetical protein VGZ22_09025, partial [Isosphaeraceae bacterium]|nr:hypothetical protein [Isosphaeraceae bacterium]
HQDRGKGPTKLGLAHQMGWIGYFDAGTLFVKRFEYQEGKPYPDGGCNFETFTNEDMLEMESLGPVVRLAPGEAVEHTERWELIGGLEAVSDEATFDAVALPRLQQKEERSVP